MQEVPTSRSSVLLDKNTDAAAQALEEHTGLTRSNLVSSVFAANPSLEVLLKYVPQGVRRNFSLTPQLWDLVDLYTQQAKQLRPDLVKADIIRAALRMAIAHCQPNESTEEDAPPG